MSIKIDVNPNKELANKIRKTVSDNGGYCPCALEKSEDTKCMCKDFRDSQETRWCNCGLYHIEFKGKD